MNNMLKFVAANAPFDVAQYTWVHVTRSEVMAMPFEDVRDRLAEHGDYAIPLKLKYIKQPFEKMAVLHTYGKIDDNLPESWQRYMVYTLDSKDSLPHTLRLWSSKAHDLIYAETGKRVRIKDAIIATTYFYPDPADIQKHNVVDDKGLVQISKEIPKEMRELIMEDLVTTCAYSVYYIVSASYGLLNKDLTFYKPTATGNNAKRLRKGKPPLYEWQTVSIHKPSPALPSAPKGGTHASPRLHQRRGHWAVSKLGKKYWRRETVVGNPDNGMLFHDYTTKENQNARH